MNNVNFEPESKKKLLCNIYTQHHTFIRKDIYTDFFFKILFLKYIKYLFENNFNFKIEN